MYNRYIPQPDGTHRRNRIPEPVRPTPPPPHQEPPCPPPEPKPCHVVRQAPLQQGQNRGIGGFLNQILPRDFDVGDLIVVLLLLLMAADSQEEQNTALLTLALYLFL